MEKATKRKLIIGLSVTALAGIGIYLYSQYRKNKSSVSPSLPNDAVNNTVSSGSTSSSLPCPPSSIDLESFQKWVRDFKKDSSIGNPDGVCGDKTKTAWSKYGSEYENYLKNNIGSVQRVEFTKDVYLYSKLPVMNSNIIGYVPKGAKAIFSKNQNGMDIVLVKTYYKKGIFGNYDKMYLSPNTLGDELYVQPGSIKKV